MSTILLLAFLATAPATECPFADVAHADADLVIAQNLVYVAVDPAKKKIASELLLAAVERKRAITALCTMPDRPTEVNPFEMNDDPWDVAANDGEIVWLAQNAVIADIKAAFENLENP